MLQPAENSADSYADWLELYLLATRTKSVGAEAARNLLGEVGAPDASAGMALNAMHRRSSILGDAYPFSVSALGVTAVAGASLYVTMLILASSDAPFRRSTAGFTAAATLFEKLTCAAAPALLGIGTQAIRFGWPSDVGRPQDFPSAIGWLAGLMGIKPGRAYRPPRRQDGGVDVIAWRPFGDAKPGFPIVLVQCTLERDFIHKSRDIDLRTWAGWLAFDTDPMAVLAMPHSVSKDEDWREMAANVVVLDRIRLALLLLQAGQKGDEHAHWISEQLDGISMVQP